MLHRGAIPVLALAVALAGCATASPSGSAGPSPTASPAPEPPTQILFRFESFEYIGGFVPRVTLYADGRLLTWDLQADRLWLRTLTDSGIDEFVAGLRATGSFDRSHNVPIELLPGVEMPGIDVEAHRFRLWTGDGWIEVTNAPRVPANVFAPSEERDALAALADEVGEAAWISADGWLDANPIPYPATAFLLFSGFYGAGPDAPCPPGTEGDICARDVSSIDWPVSLPDEGFGDPFRSADGTQSVVDHCMLIGPAFAGALGSVLLPDLAGGIEGHLYLYATIPWRSRTGWYDLVMRPLLPEESSTCAGKSLPPVIGP